MPEPLSGRAPAILFYNGHWWVPGKAKEDFQAFCINMARLGFVVLSFDAFGQGERGVSNRDHRRTEALLAGISQQGFAEYETQCALSYLLARPEVDPDRIGMTGASGGGYNTWITAALDDRIKVVVPVVGTSDFYEQLSALPVSRLVQRERALPLCRGPDPLREQPRIARDGGPAARADHCGRPRRELPGHRRSRCRRIRAGAVSLLRRRGEVRLL